MDCQRDAHLGDFWLAGPARLLPALFVMLAMVTAWVTLLDRARLGNLRGAVAAAATYSSNWYLISTSQSYFSRFAAPQPLDHLWSLAVEEQFYLIWPWVLLAGMLSSGAGPEPLRGLWLALPTLALAAGSAYLMVVLYHPAVDPTRVYEGTDTRACALLIGAALAMLWPSRPRHRQRADGRVLDVPAFAGLIVIGLMIWRVGQYSSFIYHGGLALLAVARAAVLAATPARAAWRRHARLAAAALDRRPVLRHLPVALPGHRAHLASQQRGEPGPGGPADGRQHRPGRTVLEVRRRAGAARCHRAGLEAGQDRQAGQPRPLEAGGRRRRSGVVLVACTGLAGLVAVPATSSAAALGAATGALAGSTNSVSHASARQPGRKPGAGIGSAAERPAPNLLHVGGAYRRLDVRGLGVV